MKEDVFSGSWSFTFRVEKPGPHTVSCGITGRGSAISAAFTITSFPNVRIHIYSESASTVIKPYPGCLPPEGGTLRINANNRIYGSCSHLRSYTVQPDTVTYQLTFQGTGTIDGTLDPIQNRVSFEINTSSILRSDTGGEYLLTFYFASSGNMITPTEATGTATFSARCTLIRVGKPVSCGSILGEDNSSGWVVQGTVPWRMSFQ
jgi:hypothetical protein